MPELNRQLPIGSESNSLTVQSPQPSQSDVPSYGSMSYTVANAVPVTIDRGTAENAESQPLTAASVRVISSIVRTKVNEAAIRRDTSNDL